MRAALASPKERLGVGANHFPANLNAHGAEVYATQQRDPRLQTQACVLVPPGLNAHTTHAPATQCSVRFPEVHSTRGKNPHESASSADFNKKIRHASNADLRSNSRDMSLHLRPLLFLHRRPVYDTRMCCGALLYDIAAGWMFPIIGRAPAGRSCCGTLCIDQTRRVITLFMIAYPVTPASPEPMIQWFLLDSLMRGAYSAEAPRS